MTETSEVGEDGAGLLKVAQVAKLLNVSEVTVWRQIAKGPAEGGLESIKVGRSRRVSPEAVEAYKKQHANSQPSAA